MKLSAALIVRDESRWLPGCLASLEGRVDEVVVVDTGSRDDSVAIARAHGARVLSHEWADDFSAARNAALDACSGDWILYVDADERVVRFDRPALEALCADRRWVALTVRFKPQTGYTRYREYRLFRNRPDVRFRGVIHETLLPAVAAVCEREGLAIGASDVQIDHFGYDVDSRAKHQRNLPLLEARLRADPRHVYSWTHLGITRLALADEAGAEDAWLRAIDCVRAQSQVSPPDALPYLRWCAFLLDRNRDASALLAEADALFPQNPSVTWLRGRDRIARGRYEEAMPLFAQLARTDPEAIPDGLLAYDASIFGASAHAALGLCAYRLGRFDESATHYARAESLEPDNVELRTKRMWAEVRTRR